MTPWGLVPPSQRLEPSLISVSTETTDTMVLTVDTDASVRIVMYDTTVVYIHTDSGRVKNRGARVARSPLLIRA